MGASYVSLRVIPSRRPYRDIHSYASDSADVR